jgi:hypothetical protein|tara:strand:+ start:71 stop:463 length:393 start_codon:yes stop_codon:yes gene_type:complete
MLSTHTTYDFLRTGTETTSITITLGVYKGVIPRKTVYTRTTPDQDSDFTAIERDDYSSQTPEETSTFSWNIPSDLRTTTQPVDRTGTTPERTGEFENKFDLIKMALDDDSDYTNTRDTLFNKYTSEDFTL